MLRQSDQDSIFGDNPTPRYLQLANLFRARIARGEWHPEERLPSFESLAAEFGVARVTVRQAMEQLARDGLVLSQRGRGTFVIRRPRPARWLRLHATLRELADMYREDRPELVLLEEAAAHPEIAPDEGAPAPEYRYLRRVHSRDGERYCVISIYLDERVFERAVDRFRAETVIPVLLELPGLTIARAHQTLRVGAADVEAARHLGVPLNAPVAEVRRVCLDTAGTVVYLGEITYRGDFVRYEMDLG